MRTISSRWQDRSAARFAVFAGVLFLGGYAVLALADRGGVDRDHPDGAAPADDPAVVEDWTFAPPPTRANLPTLPPAPIDRADRLDTEVAPEVWDRMADCESGDWDADAVPRPGTARWDYGLDFDHGDHFEGGLNFHPDTWETYRDPDMPGHAGRATRVQEIEVAERVLEDQGWRAWPVCSQKMDVPSLDQPEDDDSTASSGA